MKDDRWEPAVGNQYWFIDIWEERFIVSRTYRLSFPWGRYPEHSRDNNVFRTRRQARGALWFIKRGLKMSRYGCIQEDRKKGARDE